MNNIKDRLQDENDFDYEFRLCILKHTKQLDISYEEIKELTNNPCSPEHIRKCSYGYMRVYKNQLHKRVLDGKTRILALSDFHIPFQLPLETFKDFTNEVDILVLNGDILDCKNISKFPKLYRQSTMEEMIIAREYLTELIRMINPKKVYINYGNHELRFQNFLAACINDDLIELLPKTPLKLIADNGFYRFDKQTNTETFYTPLKKIFEDEIEIIYTDNWYCQIGQTIFVHPCDFRSGILKTVDKANTYFKNEGYSFSSIVMAHTHRVGEFTVGNVNLYETGACCDVERNRYSEGKMIETQKEGFLYLVQDENGKALRDESILRLLN